MSPKKDKSQPKIPVTPSAVKTRARQFTTSGISPDEKVAKNPKISAITEVETNSKMENDDIKAMIAAQGEIFKTMADNLTKNSDALRRRFDHLEKSLGDKIESVQNEVREIKVTQTAEQEERVKLGLEVQDLKEQVKHLTIRLDTLPPPPPPPNMTELAQNVLPLVSTSFATNFAKDF